MNVSRQVYKKVISNFFNIFYKYFNFSYEASNGIKVNENGYTKHITGIRARGNFAPDDPTPDEDDVLVQSGGYSYTAPDGTLISLT